MLANLIKFLDPSVKHWDDTLLMGQNHNVRTVMHLLCKLPLQTNVRTAVCHTLCFNICTLATPLNRYPSKTFKGLTAFVFINLVSNLDPSVKHWDDKKGSTGIFVSALAMHLTSIKLEAFC